MSRIKNALVITVIADAALWALAWYAADHNWVIRVMAAVAAGAMLVVAAIFWLAPRLRSASDQRTQDMAAGYERQMNALITAFAACLPDKNPTGPIARLYEIRR